MATYPYSYKLYCGRHTETESKTYSQTNITGAWTHTGTAQAGYTYTHTESLPAGSNYVLVSSSCSRDNVSVILFLSNVIFRFTSTSIVPISSLSTIIMSFEVTYDISKYVGDSYRTFLGYHNKIADYILPSTAVTFTKSGSGTYVTYSYLHNTGITISSTEGIIINSFSISDVPGHVGSCEARSIANKLILQYQFSAISSFSTSCTITADVTYPTDEKVGEEFKVMSDKSALDDLSEYITISSTEGQSGSSNTLYVFIYNNYNKIVHVQGSILIIDSDGNDYEWSIDEDINNTESSVVSWSGSYECDYVVSSWEMDLTFTAEGAEPYHYVA